MGASPFLLRLNQLIYHKMKALFIVMLATMMTSLALLCAAIISGDLVTFAFSTGASLISVLGTCVLAGVLDDRRV